MPGDCTFCKIQETTGKQPIFIIICHTFITYVSCVLILIYTSIFQVNGKMAKGLPVTAPKRKAFTKWLADHCFTIQGDYLYHRNCLNKMGAGQYTILSLHVTCSNLTHINAGNNNTLAKVRKKVQLAFNNNTTTDLTTKTSGSNKSKPPFMRVLFGLFVLANRTTNGRKTSTIRFWLHSNFARLAHHPEREQEKEEESFNEAFIKYFLQLQFAGLLLCECCFFLMVFLMELLLQK